jgi:hypothetical protein
MLILGAIAAMLGIMVVFMLAAGLYLMWRLAHPLQGIEYHLAEVAKCLREELDEMRASNKPMKYMVLPPGLLPPAGDDKAPPPTGGRYM